MSDIKVSTGQFNGNSPATEASDSEESMATLKLQGVEVEDENNPESSQPNEPAEDVVDDDLAPSCVEKLNCNAEEAGGATTPPGQHISAMDEKLRPIEELVQHLLNKADEFQTHHVHRCDHLQNEGFSQVVAAFLRTYQPYLTYLESNAHSVLPQRPPLPAHIRSRLLDFSQQLCTRLEQLLLTFANYKFLSLDESEPDSVSHFYAGRCQVEGMTLSAFRYCQPTPYLAGLGTGPFKRMRWNVERPRESRETEGEMAGGETGGEAAPEKAAAAVVTEYYFLCYEDVPEEHTQGEGAPVAEPVRKWSIGRWVQTHPDPKTDGIYDWILCAVPQGQYHRLLCLGSEEPSACIATDCLVGVLLSQRGPEKSGSPEAVSPRPNSRAGQTLA